MKTLVVYNKNGNILFTQSPVEDDYTVACCWVAIR